MRERWLREVCQAARDRVCRRSESAVRDGIQLSEMRLRDGRQFKSEAGSSGMVRIDPFTMASLEVSCWGASRIDITCLVPIKRFLVPARCLDTRDLRTHSLVFHRVRRDQFFSINTHLTYRSTRLARMDLGAILSPDSSAQSGDFKRVEVKVI